MNKTPFNPNEEGGRLAPDISEKITSEQVDEVRGRIAQVESAEVELIPGDEALARARSLLSQHLPTRV